MAAREKVTLEAFKRFAFEPANADRNFELISGEIVEKPNGSTLNSSIAANLVVAIGSFCKEHRLPCSITGEAGPYLIGAHVLVPDCAYKPTPATSEYPDPDAPLWVAEVVSSNDKPREIRAKRAIDLQAGILYWEIYPEDQIIDVHAPGQPVRSYNAPDTLDAGNLLPGFSVQVREIFA